MDRRGTLAFVAGRYGIDVVGGAETVLREMAHGLADRGWDVHVLTTCARDHFTWENVYPPGVVRSGGVEVRRFPAVVSTPRRERAAFNASIVTGQPLTIVEQERWMNDDVRMPDLFHFLLDHAPEYRAIVFAPYLFWPAYAGGQVAPDRTILMPCLHDEPEAYLPIFRPPFSGARGIWFLSEPEAALAGRINGSLRPHAVIGSGLHVPEHYDPDGFRSRHGINGPFVLYAGRREDGKNWTRLLDDFASAVISSDLPLSLVTMGHGRVDAPSDIADRVIDLGFVSDRERDDAFAAADAYVQPSKYESFSRTIMEAWLAGTLVIANGAAEVNRWHCERSGAGLLYDDDLELEECLRFVAERPDAAAEIAAAGRDYVLEHYRWPDVLDRVEETLDEWLPFDASRASREERVAADVPRGAPQRILMVTPYPPRHDGLAQYAVQEVKELRRAGHDVTVLSPEPSAGHEHLDFHLSRGLLALAKRVRAYDRVIIQFHPATFYRLPITPAERRRVALGFLVVAALSRELEFRVHEFDIAGAHGTTLDARLTRAMWRAVDRLTVHTATERDGLAAAFELPAARIDVREHGAHFEARSALTRDDARDELGLSHGEYIFLCIGFIQSSKGFDRAVRAFGRLASPPARLHIVGSVRAELYDEERHLEDLEALVERTPGVELHTGYVSDDRFDTWIIAADVVVCPYRFIWSSGVIERARLYERPVIASNVGGLADQLPAGGVVVDDDGALVRAMRRFAGDDREPTGLDAASGGEWCAGEALDRADVMRTIQSRAAARRGAAVVASADPAHYGAADRSAVVRRVPPLSSPPAVSARPGATLLKRAVRRLTGWEIDPIVGQLNYLRRAIIEALEGTSDEKPVDS